MIESIIEILWKFAAIALLIFFNGFFVASEFSLVSIRKSRVEELIAMGMKSATAVQKAINNLDKYIAGTQVGITLSSLALGWIGEPALARVIEPLFYYLPLAISKIAAHSIAVGVAFFLITCLHVVLGELAPKSLALQKTEQVALMVAWPMSFIVFFFRPFIWLLNGMGNALLHCLRLETQIENRHIHSVEELEILVRQSYEAGVLDDLEKHMLQRTFRFADLVASDIMISRIDMIAFDVNMPIDTLIDKAVHSIHRRIPIYENTIDNIIGILHVQDLFRHVRQNPAQGINIRQIMRPPLIVPETIPLDKLLEQFRQQRKRMAIVVDELGGTSGLVTMEDLIEEIFGEIQGDSESSQPGIQIMPDGKILVRGDVHLHEIEERLEWILPADNADTIAGYVMACLGRTACVGDVVETLYGTIRVESMSRVRITQVSLTPRKKEVVELTEENSKKNEGKETEHD